jgi:tRNA(fMet)-specific endonuclease VapC
LIRFLIDADTAIFATTAQHPRIAEHMEQYEPGELGLSVISYAEIILGMELGKPPTPKALEAFVAAVPLQPFDEGAARAYAKLPFKRARFDRLLAAHAVSLGATIITNNPSDFADVPGLKVENWTV